MSGTLSSPSGRYESGSYEIRLAGHLDQRWAAQFEGLSLTHQQDGSTVLSGQIVDQAALHGLLQKVRDLALPLISVARVEPGPPLPAQPASTTHQPTPGSTP